MEEKVGMWSITGQKPTINSLKATNNIGQGIIGWLIKWENLMYACEVCNRSYKQNYFPLKDSSKRFDPAVRDISEEEPLLINPYEERNPERHLTFEGTTIKPLTDEGKASIEFYGLDREELNESRQDIYAPIKALEEAVQLAQGTPCEAPTVDIIPLPELFKEKVKGNPGFDFYSVNPITEILLFGEAKYKAKFNAYDAAFEQIDRFVVNGKDIDELASLEHFCSRDQGTVLKIRS